ncbi:tetratricopeptide repeat protein [Lysinibacter cavernae]|nr:tetratricopeptide repeat protein [Lysinibacter cavernae]
MVVLLGLYVVLVGQRAWLMLTSGSAVGILIGIALTVLPLITVWAVWREMSFGAKSSQLHAELLDAEDAAFEAGSIDEDAPGALSPAAVLPTSPSGRFDRAAADAAFPAYQREAEQHPTDWMAWFRLGLAYDACGDRRRARQAIRKAIVLARG